jgi:hypothetical protein
MCQTARSIHKLISVFQNKETGIKTKTKLSGISPRANYTDRATAACRRTLAPTLETKNDKTQEIQMDLNVNVNVKTGDTGARKLCTKQSPL